MVSQHGLQVVSQHALQVSMGVYPSMPSRFPGPHPRGHLRGLQAHTWGVSRPTPRGSPDPDPGGSPAHTQGGLQAQTWGGGFPGPYLGGGLQAHTQGSVSQHALRQTPQLTATAAGGTHPTGMHSCFFMFP